MRREPFAKVGRAVQAVLEAKQSAQLRDGRAPIEVAERVEAPHRVLLDETVDLGLGAERLPLPCEVEGVIADVGKERPVVVRIARLGADARQEPVAAEPDHRPLQRQHIAVIGEPAPVLVEIEEILGLAVRADHTALGAVPVDGVAEGGRGLFKIPDRLAVRLRELDHAAVGAADDGRVPQPHLLRLRPPRHSRRYRPRANRGTGYSRD